MICYYYISAFLHNLPIVSAGKKKKIFLRIKKFFFLLTKETMEICPLCKNTREEAQWINCDACKTWLHTACLNLTLVDDIKKFYCPSCTKTHGPTTCKLKTSCQGELN